MVLSSGPSKQPEEFPENRNCEDDWEILRVHILRCFPGSPYRFHGIVSSDVPN